MLAHVRVAWATDLRHLVHLLQPEYASFLRFPRFFPYMRRFTPIIELNRPLSKTKPVLRELTAQKTVVSPPQVRRRYHRLKRELG